VNLASLLDPHPHDAVALISRGKTTTYGQLREQVAGFRGGLHGLGLQPGDRLALLCANNWYFVVSYLSALSAGLVVVPLNPMSTARELQAELSMVGARAVVLGPAARHAFHRIDAAALPSLEHVIDCGTPDAGSRLLLDDVMAARPRPMVARRQGDLAALLFTSGTSGRPKAAMLTHGNLWADLEHTGRTLGGRPGEVVLGVLPLFHIFGLNVTLGACLHAGAKLVLIERFDPASAAESVARWKVTVAAGPPNMWAAMASLPDVTPEQFASLRVAVSGAAPLSEPIRAMVEQRLGVALADGYGLTETAPTVTSSVGVQRRAGSIGQAVAGVEVRLVDERGADVLVGDAGEVWVRGPNVFKGYWNDPDATAAALTPDGWLRTGDVAVVDDDGYLYLVDRIKDLIIVSGFNVYPAEVEAALVEHPGIASAAVIGLPHPHTGETVKAFVVAASGYSIEEDDIITFARERLARYKCPTKIQFVDRLPEGPAGKLFRRELRSG
jgi:long-chain acyl-CoA synthetase